MMGYACVCSNPAPLNEADTSDYISSTIQPSLRSREDPMGPRLQALSKVGLVLVGIPCCHESTDMGVCALSALGRD